MSDLLLSFVSDDFSGATDSLEVLMMAGTKPVLFLDFPDSTTLARYPEIRAFGVAGISRSLPTAELASVVRDSFKALHHHPSQLIHYKVCSTFDSTATIGSIGRAIDVGAEVFGTRRIPLVVGAPKLRRWVAFGNLFAGAGDEIHRLDRHPTMSRHPVTPMREADLRRILAEQTARPVHLIDLLALDCDQAGLPDHDGVILFDTVSEDHMARIGRAIWEGRIESRFVAGSSGVEYALKEYWGEVGITEPLQAIPEAQPVPLLPVVTGSASPVTLRQIEWAESHGWTSRRMDTLALVEKRNADSELAALEDWAVECLQSGQSPILYAARGPEDPLIEETRRKAMSLGIQHPGRMIAEAQGLLLRRILERVPIDRFCVAGGDTSGHVARALGIEALECVRPLTPGGPICRARSPIPWVDGRELVLKGGQVGGPDYLSAIQGGKLPSTPSPIGIPIN